MADFNLKAILEFVNKSGPGVKEATKDLSGLEKAADVVSTALTAGTAVAIAKTTYELAEMGAQGLRTEHAFEMISGGADQATANLAAMQQATRGAISDVDAMASANRLMQMGLASNAQELGNVTEMAVRLGTAMGRDAKQSIEEFALLLANQSIPRLDTFGISAGKVRTRILELQKANEGMTREQAFMIATMEEGNKAMARLGDNADDLALGFEQAQAATENLKMSISQGLAVALENQIVLMGRVAQWTSENADKTEAWGDAILTVLTAGIWPMIDGLTEVGLKLTETKEEAEEVVSGFDLATDSMLRMEYAADKEAAALEEATKAMEEQLAAAEALRTKGLDMLAQAIDGPVGAANEEFAAQQADIASKIADVQKQLDYYRSLQGVVVGSTEDLTIATYEHQQATERLDNAQQALAENTDPEKQLELQAAVAQASQALDGASDAMGRAGPRAADYSKTIGELEGELTGLNGQLRDLEATHTAAMNKIVYDMMMARLATDGWTNAEVQLAIQTANSMGMIDDATAEMAQNVNAELEAFAQGQGIVETIAGLDRISEAARGVGPVISDEMLEQLKMTSPTAWEQASGFREAMDSISTDTPAGELDDIVTRLGELPSSADEAYAGMQASLDKLNTDIPVTELERVVQMANSIPRTINIKVNVDAPSSIPGLPSGAYQAGTGFHTGGMALIGEMGPELVNLPRGSRVYPASSPESRAAQVSNSYGGDTVIIQDRLAAALYFEQRRREKLQRLENRM